MLRRLLVDQKPAASGARSDRRSARAASYAKRFAAKEACSKALGTGFRKGVFWRDMVVDNLAAHFAGEPLISQVI